MMCGVTLHVHCPRFIVLVAHLLAGYLHLQLLLKDEASFSLSQ